MIIINYFQISDLLNLNFIENTLRSFKHSSQISDNWNTASNMYEINLIWNNNNWKVVKTNYWPVLQNMSDVKSFINTIKFSFEIKFQSLNLFQLLWVSVEHG